MKKAIFAIIPLLMVLACGSGDKDKAAIIITMHDAPIDPNIVSGVFIDVRRTEIITASDQRIILSEEPIVFNILELKESNPVTLAHTKIAPGAYKQIRLILGTQNRITFTDGTSAELIVASGFQTGVKLDGAFNIPAGKFFFIDLDFRVDHSIIQTGNGTWKLKPVIDILRVGDVVGNFTFSGTIGNVRSVIELSPALTAKALTSEDPDILLLGNYFYNSATKKLVA